MLLTETLLCECCFIGEEILGSGRLLLHQGQSGGRDRDDRDRNQSGFIFLNYTSLTFLNNILQSTVILEKKTLK